jgi:DNA-binding SARP family transcriptional activator
VPVANLDGRKVQELLAYLLLRRERPQVRDTLAGQLWADQDPEQARRYLRQALWQLQSALDAVAPSGAERMLLVEEGFVRVRPHAAFRLDVGVIDALFTRIEAVPGRALSADDAAAAKDAVALFRGELLEGWYADWCIQGRARYERIYLALLEKLMDYCQACQEYEAGLLYGDQLLRRDRSSETTHRRMMRLHHLSGDRAAALQQYRRCAETLAEEFGETPSPRTEALRELILADEFDTTFASASGREPPAALAVSLLPSAGAWLHQFLADVTHLQVQLQQQIQAAELLLTPPR